jgi:hypothetical protein
MGSMHDFGKLIALVVFLPGGTTAILWAIAVRQGYGTVYIGFLLRV